MSARTDLPLHRHLDLVDSAIGLLALWVIARVWPEVVAPQSA